MSLLMEFTPEQVLAAKYHFSEAADCALASYWNHKDRDFHNEQLARQLSRACKALGITIDASGKVEKIPEDAAKDARIMAEVG